MPHRFIITSIGIAFGAFLSIASGCSPSKTDTNTMYGRTLYRLKELSKVFKEISSEGARNSDSVSDMLSEYRREHGRDAFLHTDEYCADGWGAPFIFKKKLGDNIIEINVFSERVVASDRDYYRLFFEAKYQLSSKETAPQIDGGWMLNTTAPLSR